MLKLVSKSDTYEKVWKEEGDVPEERPVFILKKLSSGEVNSMDDQLTTLSGVGGKAKVSLLVGTGRRLKIKYALVDWKNVVDENRKPVPCSDEAKERLPANIQAWLEQDIDIVNALKGVGVEERKNL